MSLKAVAKETIKILESGQYTNNSGQIVNFAEEQKKAERETKLYTPEQLQKLLSQSNSNSGNQLLIEVVEERTQTAAHRLITSEECSDLVLLNFASARNPGGGFINGAKAQEEDLARCSGLYLCLLKQPKYYQMNREQKSLIYTDHIIYAPQIPWFRTHRRKFLDNYFVASVITAPAPNAGQILRRDSNAQPRILEALQRRAGYVLTVARDNRHRNLLLGAWGCGVFRNNPLDVAGAFAGWLNSPEFQGCFDRVVFAIYDSTKEKMVLSAFKNYFE